jgi:hypothetical protein
VGVGIGAGCTTGDGCGVGVGAGAGAGVDVGAGAGASLATRPNGNEYPLLLLGEVPAGLVGLLAAPASGVAVAARPKGLQSAPAGQISE